MYLIIVYIGAKLQLPLDPGAGGYGQSVQLQVSLRGLGEKFNIRIEIKGHENHPMKMKKPLLEAKIAF